MKHRIRILGLPTALLAAALAGPVAAQSSPPTHPPVTVESIRPVVPPTRPDSGKLLIQPGEPMGSLSDHSGNPGRDRGRSLQKHSPERANLLTDDTRRR